MGTQSNVVVAKIDAGFIKVGPYGTAEGSCVDVGYTIGGIDIMAKRKYYDVEVDQELGYIDSLKYFEELTFKMALAEATFENMCLALDIPAAALSNNVLSFGGDKTQNKKVVFINITTPSGATYKLQIFKVVAFDGGGQKYVKNKETVLDVTFRALQDTSQQAGGQVLIATRAGNDATPPTIALSAPVSGGTVTKATKGAIVLTITEANLMNQNSIKYGDTVNIYDITTPSAPVLVAGSIAYDPTAKTITFTPTNNWVASDKLMVVVSTGLADNAGNRLAAAYVDYLTVTA